MNVKVFHIFHAGFENLKNRLIMLKCLEQMREGCVELVNDGHAILQKSFDHSVDFCMHGFPVDLLIAFKCGFM